MSEDALSGLRPNVAPLPRLGFTMQLQKVGLNATLLSGLVLLGIVMVAAAAAPLLTPYDPIAQSLGDAFQPPFSPDHVLGTDNFGRDIWSRIVYSARLDLQIALISVLFPSVFGGLVGIATGYVGGRLETLFMPIVDVLMAFPFFVMVLAIVTGPTLSFLGSGPPPPTPEWGAMIAAGRQFLMNGWWMTALPGVALLIVGVALSLIGDGLADRS